MGVTWEEFKRDPREKPAPVVTNELLAKMILAHARMTAAVFYKSRGELYAAGARLAEFAREAGITVEWR